MMKLLDELLETLPAEPIAVRRVIIGVHWTLVSSQRSGLASTLVGSGPHGHSPVRDVGDLEAKSAQELAGWALSDNLLEASIGMAAINSLIEVDETCLQQVNAAEVIAQRCQGKNLAIVGHFPFAKQMKTLAANCWVIEKRPMGDEFPEESAREFIPQADVVAITGTALINHSMEGLLSLCPRGALVVVLGPSTPLSPLLFDYGVTFLSGSLVVDEARAIATIQQGAIFPQVQGVKLVTLGREE